ncbi:MAG: FHA domain-containing protein [Rhodocyclales bacterium]|nr:FHA domain-containing protein [Rhodocyclales bacterium]
MAKLVLSSGGNILHQYFIDEAPVGIGRDASNTVHIDHPTVSRQHARIVSVGEDHIIEDLGGSNGTFVNGSRIDRRILQHRDIVDCGAYQLRYLNTRLAAEVELDRTMLISALPGDVRPAVADDLAASQPIPARRQARVRFPSATVRRLSGPGAGQRVPLDRVVATFGRPGHQVVVITRRPHGFFLSPVEGDPAVRIGGRSVTEFPHPLRDGDEIEVDGQFLEFTLNPAA